MRNVSLSPTFIWTSFFVKTLYKVPRDVYNIK